jgi:hypothetical protein
MAPGATNALPIVVTTSGRVRRALPTSAVQALDVCDAPQRGPMTGAGSRGPQGPLRRLLVGAR